VGLVGGSPGPGCRGRRVSGWPPTSEGVGGSAVTRALAPASATASRAVAQDQAPNGSFGSAGVTRRAWKRSVARGVWLDPTGSDHRV